MTCNLPLICILISKDSQILSTKGNQSNNIQLQHTIQDHQVAHQAVHQELLLNSLQVVVQEETFQLNLLRWTQIMDTSGLLATTLTNKWACQFTILKCHQQCRPCSHQ